MSLNEFARTAIDAETEGLQNAGWQHLASHSRRGELLSRQLPESYGLDIDASYFFAPVDKIAQAFGWEWSKELWNEDRDDEYDVGHISDRLRQVLDTKDVIYEELGDDVMMIVSVDALLANNIITAEQAGKWAPPADDDTLELGAEETLAADS